jgi:hypothetical protein
MKAFAPLALIVHASLVCAATPQRVVDPEVVDVRTAGSWQLGDRYGSYRVVISNLGYEQATTQVRFEWIDFSGGPASPVRIWRTEVLHDSFLGSLKIDSISVDEKGVTVAIIGETGHEAKYSCQVTLRATGIYSKSPQC